MRTLADTNSDAPLYEGVKRLLTESIAKGEWRAGEALPSETRLAQRFGVSIGTVRKAISDLVAERIVMRRQGRGTFVARHDADRMMFQFFRVVPRAGDMVYPGIRTLLFQRGRATPSDAERLQIPAAQPVFRIRNILSFEEEPIVVDDLVLPQKLFPGLTEKVLVGRDSTIYSLYQTRFDINIVRTSERLRAILAESDVARLLGISKGAPLLEIDRVARTYHDQPVELRRSMVNTARHEYLSDFAKTGRS